MSDLLETLKKLTKGLIYSSEADFAVKPFLWTKTEVEAELLTPDKVKALLKIKPNDAVEIVTLEAFFESAVALEDWFGEEEKQTAKQFQTLADTLRTNLAEIAVYKIGTAKKTVVIVGKTKDGEYAGVTTKVVET